MPQVTSLAIRRIGYDKALSELSVTFARGQIYVYYNVPERIYFDFLSAPSKGTFFQQNIRDRYAYRRK